MIVVVDGSEGTVHVEEPTVLTSLSVSSRTPDTVAVDAALRGAQLGYADDSHAWLQIDTLRALCGPQDDQWQNGFAAMIKYATGKGWVDDAGTHVRAHVESSDQAG